jgi:hypothetical protein
MGVEVGTGVGGITSGFLSGFKDATTLTTSLKRITCSGVQPVSTRAVKAIRFISPHEKMKGCIECDYSSKAPSKHIKDVAHLLLA